MSRPKKTLNINDPKCIYPVFGAAFEAAVKPLDLEDTMIADKLGITAQVVSYYRRGYMHPTLTTLAKINDVLGLELKPETAIGTVVTSASKLEVDPDDLKEVGTLYMNSKGQLITKLHPKFLSLSI